MRYAQGGGLTAERRAFREGVRREAGERFARGEKTSVIAKDLRVSERSVEPSAKATSDMSAAAIWCRERSRPRSATAVSSSALRTTAGPCRWRLWGPPAPLSAAVEPASGTYLVRTINRSVAGYWE